MVICYSAGFSYSVLMWPRFAVWVATIQGMGGLDARIGWLSCKRWVAKVQGMGG